MDYDKVEDLERYALADPGTRVTLLASLHTAATPGQLFLLGLHSLDVGDVDTAQKCMTMLECSPPHLAAQHKDELEARLKLLRWGEDPAGTSSWLKEQLHLSFNDQPPSGAAGYGTGKGAGGGAPQLPSSVDAVEYSLAAFVEAAVKRGLTGGNLARIFRPAAHKAILNMLQQGGVDAASIRAFQDTSLASPMLLPSQLGEDLFLSLLTQRLREHQPRALRNVVARMGLDQLQKLAGLMPEIRRNYGWQAACVRKLYPTSWTSPTPPRAERVAFFARVAAFINDLHSTNVPEHATAWLSLHLAAATAALQRSGTVGSADPLTLACLLRNKALSKLMDSRALLGDSSHATRAAQGDILSASFFEATHTNCLAFSEQDLTPVSCVEMDLSLGPLLSPESSSTRIVKETLQELLYASNNPAALFAPPPSPPPTSLPMPSDSYDRLPDGRACHHSIVCDLCKAYPIVGPRYRSTSHPDFDVCDACVGTEAAQAVAPFERMGETVETAGCMHGLLDAKVEAKMLSQAQLLCGRGEASVWADVYTKAGGDMRELYERVELELTADNPRGEGDGWAHPAHPLHVNVAIKNVPSLTVKLYELQPWNFFKSSGGRDIDLSIDLEGLGATKEVVMPAEPSATVDATRLIRTKRTLPLMEGGRRGVFVVDLIGGGKQSRALLRKGQLMHVERLGVAGHAISVMYEDGTVVPNARVLASGKEYKADPTTGEVQVPYRGPSSSSSSHLVLGDGDGFATLVPGWRHLEENFELAVGFHLEPEACTARCKAPLTVHSLFTVNGFPAPMSMLEDVDLSITSLDSNGTQSHTTINGFELGAGKSAAVYWMEIPERCASVRVAVSARARKVQPGSDGGPQYAYLSSSKTFKLNDPELRPDLNSTCEPYVSLCPDGSYALRVLGRSGEPIPGVAVDLHMGHVLAEGEDASLVKEVLTDVHGEVLLGHLAGIRQLRAVCKNLPHAQDASPPCKWLLSPSGLPNQSMPPSMVAAYEPNGQIWVPYPWSAERGEALIHSQSVCLLEFNTRMNEAVRDVTSTYLTAPPDKDGYLILSGLPPGSYLLAAPGSQAVGQQDQLMKVKVVAPRILADGSLALVKRGAHRFVIGENLVAALPEAKPLQIASASASASLGIQIQLAGSSDELAAANVQISLTRFLALSDHGASLSTPLAALPYRGLPPALREPREVHSRPNQYQSNRAIGDEVRYVFERRQLQRDGKVRPGVLLPRPSLLSHAHMTASTRTEKEVLRSGNKFESADYSMAPASDEMLCMAQPAMANMMCFGGAGYSARQQAPHMPASTNSLSFCPQAVVLPNVPVNADTGESYLTPEMLRQLLGSSSWDLATSGHAMLLVTAVSPVSGAASEVRVPVAGGPSPQTDAPVITTMLQRPFPQGTACMETSTCVALVPGASLVVNDMPSAMIKLMPTLGSMWLLFGALLANGHSYCGSDTGRQHWQTFSFIGRWSALTSDAKLAAYGQHACRELDYLMLKHDPEFFKDVCLPLLISKLEASRNFLDCWMLVAAASWSDQASAAAAWGAFYHQWCSPKRYSSLNALERIMLAACTPGGAAAASSALTRLASDMRAAVRARGRYERQREKQRLEVALTSGQDALQGADGEGGVEEEEEEEEEEGVVPQEGG